MPRGDHQNWGGRRISARPDAKRAGRPRKWRALRISEADALAIDGVTGGLDMETALSRIAAAAAADWEGTRAALAPLLQVEAWDGSEIL